MYANEFKTKEKGKFINWDKKNNCIIYVLYLFRAETKKIFLPF